MRKSDEEEIIKNIISGFEVRQVRLYDINWIEEEIKRKIDFESIIMFDEDWVMVRVFDGSEIRRYVFDTENFN